MCAYKDCVNESLTPEERKAQNEYDIEIIGERKYGRDLIVWKHWHSEKGKATMRRYNSSQKGKERQKRYLQTEKGKAMKKAVEKRASKKAIASGKNAEYCRNYYQRKKMQKNDNCKSIERNPVC